MAAFWIIAPCSVLDVYRRFVGAWCLHHQGVEYSQDSHIHIHWRENLKSHILM